MLAALLTALFWLIGTASFAQQLSDIQAAITAKGQKWIAKETSISKLPDNEKKLRLGLMKHKPTGQEEVLAPLGSLADLPLTLDWTTFVTPIRNQGNCGSCWAFATTAALESNILIRDNMPGTNEDHAEQILVSCSGAGDCNGGYIDTASAYIRSTGLPDESYFNYTATNNSCGNAQSGWQNDTRNIGTWSYVNTSPANLGAIKSALKNYGPLVTTMDVYYDFFSYTGGVYEYATGSYQGGHAILIVGYMDDSTRADGGYFKVKNSWGTGWGSDGYFYIGFSQLGNPVYFGEWTIAYSTPIMPPVPVAPSSLNATSASSGRINLAWTDNSNNEDGFKIERCSGASCSNFAQITTVGASVTAYSNTGLTASTSYSYRVRAYNAGGDSGYSNTAITTTQAGPPPGAPSNLTATAVSGSQISLKWADNSNNETGFRIERCEFSGCGSFSQIATVGANVTSYNNTGLKGSTSYTYQVRAYNTTGDSASSNPASAQTLCSYSISPTSKSFPASGGPGAVSVTASGTCSWTAVSNAGWITIGSQIPGTLSYSVSKNTGARRTGTITVAGLTHTVTQAKK